MAKRRRKRRAADPNEFLDDAMDAFVDSAFNRVEGFVEKIRDGQRETFDKEYLRQQFRCVSCRKAFDVDGMEMLHPDNGYGTCKGCFSFMWTAGKEKLRAFATRAQQQRVQQGAPQGVHVGAPAPPPGPPPWEVLGVKQDATVDEIKKAYREKAMMWHPDRVEPGAASGVKENARAMFEQITRARDVMMKVRQPPKG